MTTFKDELISVVQAKESKVLDALKDTIMKAAATGRTSITVDSSAYDKTCLEYLKKEWH